MEQASSDTPSSWLAVGMVVSVIASLFRRSPKNRPDPEQTRRLAEMNADMQPFQEDNQAFRADMERHAEENKGLQKLLGVSTQRAESAEQEFAKTGKMETYVAKIGEIFDNFCEGVKANIQLQAERKTEMRSVAFSGPGGVGMSSLINAVAGRGVTKVGVTDTTQGVAKVHEFEADQVEVYDVQGCSDLCPYTQAGFLLAFRRFHLVVIVYECTIWHVLPVLRMLYSVGTPCVVVRNKCEKYTEEELRRVMVTEGRVLREETGFPLPLMLCSAETGLGVEQLRRVVRGQAQPHSYLPTAEEIRRQRKQV